MQSANGIQGLIDLAELDPKMGELLKTASLMREIKTKIKVKWYRAAPKVPYRLIGACLILMATNSSSHTITTRTRIGEMQKREK